MASGIAILHEKIATFIGETINLPVVAPQISADRNSEEYCSEFLLPFTPQVKAILTTNAVTDQTKVNGAMKPKTYFQSTLILNTCVADPGAENDFSLSVESTIIGFPNKGYAGCELPINKSNKLIKWLQDGSEPNSDDALVLRNVIKSVVSEWPCVIQGLVLLEDRSYLHKLLFILYIRSGTKSLVYDIKLVSGKEGAFIDKRKMLTIHSDGGGDNMVLLKSDNKYFISPSDTNISIVNIAASLQKYFTESKFQSCYNIADIERRIDALILDLC